jgi:hypothetical protein
MTRWIILIVLTVLLNNPAVPPGGVDETLDPGRTVLFNYPFLKIPLGDSGSAAGEKKEEAVPAFDPKKEQEKLNKKVDDAIRKAWEEK